MNKKKILLIGGAGFIGFHLAKGLLEKSYEVVIVDKEKGIDANNKNQLKEIFEKEKPDTVFHLAGAIGLKQGNGDSGVERSKIIVDLCRKHRAKLIFFSSGGAIYSDPESEYAKANLEIEKIIKESEIKNVILRLSNVYGPGQWESGIIPQIIKGSPKIKGDGSQTRDFIYISDVIEVAILAINKEGSFDIGSGESSSINEIVDIIKKYKSVKPEYLGGKDISAKPFDIKKTKKDFNWEPKISLEQGLVKTIESFKL